MSNKVKVVVNEEKVSETPTVLVGESKDKQYPGELSPNPGKSGFTKQVFVDSLPDSGEPNVLYLVALKVDGGVVGYRKYKWNPDANAQKFERVFGSNANLAYKGGGYGTLEEENNAPRNVPEKIFTGEVVFLKEPQVCGLPLSKWIDKKGGVTEEELQAALQNYATSESVTQAINTAIYGAIDSNY